MKIFIVPSLEGKFKFLRMTCSLMVEESQHFSVDIEVEVFWPLYCKFDFEYAKAGDETLNLIMDYASHSENITDENGSDL